MNLALEHIDAAADAGANAVKFQCFFAENLVNPGDILEFCTQSQLGFGNFEVLQDRCRHRNVEFMLSAFCIESLKWCGLIPDEGVTSTVDI